MKLILLIILILFSLEAEEPEIINRGLLSFVKTNTLVYCVITQNHSLYPYAKGEEVPYDIFNHYCFQDIRLAQNLLNKRIEEDKKGFFEQNIIRWKERRTLR